MTPQAVAQLMAEKLAIRVLQEKDPERAVEMLFRLQDKMLNACLLVLGSLPGGPQCVAALLTVMSPVQACRCEVPAFKANFNRPWIKNAVARLQSEARTWLDKQDRILHFDSSCVTGLAAAAALRTLISTSSCSWV
jgi:hypothetical protein